MVELVISKRAMRVIIVVSVLNAAMLVNTFIAMQKVGDLHTRVSTLSRNVHKLVKTLEAGKPVSYRPPVVKDERGDL
ncbi:hypothetical protein Gekk315_00012 [Aeromonas phage Gekk3-15]